MFQQYTASVFERLSAEAQVQAKCGPRSKHSHCAVPRPAGDGDGGATPPFHRSLVPLPVHTTGNERSDATRRFESCCQMGYMPVYWAGGLGLLPVPGVASLFIQCLLAASPELTNLIYDALENAIGRLQRDSSLRRG